MKPLLLAALYGGLGLWLLSALARLHHAWEASQRRTSAVRDLLAAAARKLLSDFELIQRLDDEIKRVGDNVAIGLRDLKDRQALLDKAPRPPSPEIRLASEYPPSRNDRAWIVEFVRDAEFPPQPWERVPATSLVWARDNAAALVRARQLANEYKTYTVQTIRRF